MADSKKAEVKAANAPMAEPAPKNSEVSASNPGIKFAKMRRSHPQFPGGPVTATVHPDEVRNMSEHGWFEGP